MKLSFGSLLSSYAKTINRSQTSIAEEADITHASLNRYLNGKSVLSADALIKVLKAMDIDLYKIILDKQAELTHGNDSVKYETTFDAIKFLFQNLEPMGQQTQLKQLEWLNQIAGKKQLPKEVREIIKKETNLI